MMCKKLRRALLATVLTLCVSGCASRPPVIADCQWTRPIILTGRTVMALTNEEVAQIVRHNDLWDERCGDDVMD
jgi:hypothetical protein